MRPGGGTNEIFLLSSSVLVSCHSTCYSQSIPSTLHAYKLCIHYRAGNGSFSMTQLLLKLNLELIKFTHFSIKRKVGSSFRKYEEFEKRHTMFVNIYFLYLNFCDPCAIVENFFVRHYLSLRGMH